MLLGIVPATWVVAGPSGSRFTEDVDLSKNGVIMMRRPNAPPKLVNSSLFETTTLKAAKSKVRKTVSGTLMSSRSD